ncbi:MAG TPA: adenylate/guanylate cyclase domain-containing protein [Acidimicrobiales bacterium]|nr:adenylate/guanylate cyclase domain-containing protein [Acidimicrobiales bacterium]
MGDAQVEYVRTADGVHIAYQVQGDGPVDILEIGGFGTLFPQDAAAEQPRWHRFEDRLRRFARLTKFDLRGIGYSDPYRAPPTVDDYVSDAAAVLDAAGIGRAVLFATSFGGFAAIEFAARFPERVVSLVLANTAARFSPDDGYVIVDEAVARRSDERRAAVEPGSGSKSEESDIDLMAPSLATDADARRWWSRTAQRGAGPAVAADVWDMALAADVRSDLPAVVAPTLVLVTTGNRFVDPAFGHWLAERLENVEVCEVDAPDHVVWAVPDDAVVNEIERYLTGSLVSGSRHRSMSAVLFTDIVESTTHNAERGDRAWIEQLTRHDDLAAREINLRGGRIVKRLGDGLLAVFPLASDALDAATAVTSGAQAMGIGVRAGVHVAEVEEVGDDVLGIGVTVAARVLAEASGGQVLTTRATADVLAGSMRTFKSLGRRELKGVSGDWELLVSTP